MKKIKTVINLISQPSRIILLLNSKGIRVFDDKKYIKMLYKLKFGRDFDLEDPKTFNEKLQWLKIYNRREEYTRMVDKFEVKEYVSRLIGEKYVVPTIGVYDKFEKIDFECLPKKFVMKCTHDSGGVIICDKNNNLDMNGIRKKINKCLRRNFYYLGREWPYKNVKPRIIIEKYMIDRNYNELRDYKFFCFNGKVKFFKVDFNRFIKHQANYYDKNAKLLKFGEEVCPPDYGKKITMPTNLKEMIKLAEKLSKNIPFVRVDFYDVDGNIYFGEMTFFPASGFGKFIPEEWDEKIGRMLKLPIEKKGL